MVVDLNGCELLFEKAPDEFNNSNGGSIALVSKLKAGGYTVLASFDFIGLIGLNNMIEDVIVNWKNK